MGWSLEETAKTKRSLWMRQKWRSEGPLYGSAQVRCWIRLSKARKSWTTSIFTMDFSMDPFPLKLIPKKKTSWRGHFEIVWTDFYIILCFSNYIPLGYVIEGIFWYFYLMGISGFSQVVLFPLVEHSRLEKEPSWLLQHLFTVTKMHIMIYLHS